MSTPPPDPYRAPLPHPQQPPAYQPQPPHQGYGLNQSSPGAQPLPPYGAAAGPVPTRSGNTPALLSTIFAAGLLLWELIQAVAGQLILRGGDYDTYQVLYGFGTVITSVLALAALGLGIAGAVSKKGGKVLAGVGMGIGAYVLVLSLVWLVLPALAG